MATIERIIERGKKQIPNFDEAKVRAAYEFAAEKHCDQKRSSGENYISHPLAVANILLDFSPDEDSICAALLHDICEDCGVNCETISKKFGKTVAHLVDGLSKLSRVNITGEERQINSLRKMFLSMARDVRVVLIKLCDRLHNMQTLHFLNEKKQQKIAHETLQIYAPIAARLGIFSIKAPLEDLAFFYLLPEKYENIQKQMKTHTSYREGILKNAKKKLSEILKKEKIDGEISARVKHFYSIFKKMERKNFENVDELYDIFALRIIVPKVSDCYALLGRVHQSFIPLSKRFKDYIAVPKPNGYRSLHTTVLGLSGLKEKSLPIEIQIRTKKMQHEAEFGIAAHWNYKENKEQKADEKSRWIVSLLEIEKTQKDNTEFMNDLRIDTFSDRIFVLTPRGEVRDLPAGATPVDFAFSIHTDIGLTIKMAKINGKIAPLDSILKNGDVVEIIKSKTPRPHQHWLSFVKTSIAKNQIRRFFASQDRDKILRDGREILNKVLEKFGLPPLSPHLKILQEFDKNRKTLHDREELLEHVGNGSLAATLIVKKILRNRGIFLQKKEKVEKEKTPDARKSEILIDNQSGIPVHLAQCCAPQLPEPIIGFVNRGKSISVHSQNCKNLEKIPPSQLVEARWAEAKQPEKINLKIFTNKNRPGVLAEITQIFADKKINIEKISPQKLSPLHFEIDAEIEVPNFEILESVFAQIEKIYAVEKICKV